MPRGNGRISSRTRVTDSAHLISSQIAALPRVPSEEERVAEVKAEVMEAARRIFPAYSNIQMTNFATKPDETTGLSWHYAGIAAPHARSESLQPASERAARVLVKSEPSPNQLSALLSLLERIEGRPLVEIEGSAAVGAGRGSVSGQHGGKKKVLTATEGQQGPGDESLGDLIDLNKEEDRDQSLGSPVQSR